MRNLPGCAMVVDEEEQKGMLKIGEVAKLSGIGIEALRFYEKSGLLERPERTESEYQGGESVDVGRSIMRIMKETQSA
jgi:hypothetical protein